MTKTVSVKLHNPSNHRRAILDRAFLRWTLASDAALRWAGQHLDICKDCKDQRGNCRGNLIASVLRESLHSKFAHFGLHSSLEDALYRDIGKTLASYFSHLAENPNISFPSIPHARPNPARYEAALDALVTWDPTNAAGPSWAQVQSELYSASGDLLLDVRPMYFANTDAVPRHRGYSILYDEQKDQYLALLCLLPRSASRRYRKPLKVHRPLLGLNRHENYLVETGRPSGGFLFPLAMGSWQKETFFDPALSEPEIIRTAYLVRRQNRQGDAEYYLHIAVDLPAAMPVDPVNFLGVHHTLRGDSYAMVLNPEGDVLHYEQLVEALDLEDAARQRQMAQRRGRRSSSRVIRERTKHHYHIASNRIVDLAQQYHAYVGVEDLSYVRNRTKSTAINRLILSAPVGKLTQLLEYKLPFAGLPTVLQVRGISPRDCHRCGGTSRDKTVKADGQISCPLCGLEMDEHENTARLVAAEIPSILDHITAARERRQMSSKDS